MASSDLDVCSDKQRVHSSNKKYQEWIANYLKDHPNPIGECQKATKEMLKAFPELKIVRGHVETVFCGRQGHWWLESPDGAIVDPTRRQFQGPIDYEPWTPDSLVRVGKCMNCGEEIWRKVASLDQEYHDYFCSKECEKETIDEMNKPNSYPITPNLDSEDFEIM